MKRKTLMWVEEEQPICLLCQALKHAAVKFFRCHLFDSVTTSALTGPQSQAAEELISGNPPVQYLLLQKHSWIAVQQGFIKDIIIKFIPGFLATAWVLQLWISTPALSSAELGWLPSCYLYFECFQPLKETRLRKKQGEDKGYSSLAHTAKWVSVGRLAGLTDQMWCVRHLMWEGNMQDKKKKKACCATLLRENPVDIYWYSRMEPRRGLWWPCTLHLPLKPRLCTVFASLRRKESRPIVW